MKTDEWALVISVLTLFFTAFSTYITYKGYMLTRRGKPKGSKGGHRKSNRKVLAKLSVALSIKVTKD